MGLLDRFKKLTANPKKTLFEKMKSLGEQYYKYVKTVFPRFTEKERSRILGLASEHSANELYHYIYELANPPEKGSEQSQGTEQALFNKLSSLKRRGDRRDARKLYQQLPNEHKSIILSHVNIATAQELYSLIREHARSTTQSQPIASKKELEEKLMELPIDKAYVALDKFSRLSRNRKKEILRAVPSVSADKLYKLIKRGSGLRALSRLTVPTSIRRKAKVGRAGFKAGKKLVKAGQKLKDVRRTVRLARRKTKRELRGVEKPEPQELELNQEQLSRVEEIILNQLKSNYCMHCGGMINPGDKYCMYCGQPVK